ncbi:Helix-turn-helix domain-containing protein [Lentibacillus halodurans]|uniref:Helix-turn-helix domain-containing protein n=1 Tax=Lentibacillus halodurans TaxID=237679 RepID=A0A1I0YG84_9BACI|nr:GntR family transcriptional regulator YhfZ [Lentibacillus halodurans]SFB12379.1 Helix-turn-helix domain-containing protein [Lentibacillus halodurans]
MGGIWESLYSKNGLAAKEIAKMLIPIEKGNRIPRIDDFAQKLTLGRGTVQGGLKVLENLQAIEIESRGHLGTYLMNKDEYVLKEVAGVGSYLGAMPLPYSKMYEGLATGLIEVSDRKLNRINLAYMRGAKKRIEALKARRCDFVVMSLLAAEEEMKEDNNLQVIKNFGPFTYVSSHKIFLANQDDDRIKDGMRVGIDYTSIDQSKITLLESKGIDVELVTVNYMQLFEQLLTGSIDAAVWNSDEVKAAETLKRIDFHSEQANLISEKASTSVILMEKGRTDIATYLTELDEKRVVEIQKMVLDHEKLPHY